MRVEDAATAAGRCAARRSCAPRRSCSRRSGKRGCTHRTTRFAQRCRDCGPRPCWPDSPTRDQRRGPPQPAARSDSSAACAAVEPRTKREPVLPYLRQARGRRTRGGWPGSHRFALVRGSTAAQRRSSRSGAGWGGPRRWSSRRAIWPTWPGPQSRHAVRPGGVRCVQPRFPDRRLQDSGVPTIVAPHNDPAAVAAILDAHPGSRRWWSPSRSSPSTATSPRCPRCTSHVGARALLLIDDAHALGVLGRSGAGAWLPPGSPAAPAWSSRPRCPSRSVAPRRGGGPAEFIAHLVDTGRTFIYDTALPRPWSPGSTRPAHRPRADDRRALLAARSAEIVSRLRPRLRGFHAGRGVLSVPAPGPEAAVAWAADCLDRGVAVGCFRRRRHRTPRPPPPDAERGRADADFARALAAIVECAP